MLIALDYDGTYTADPELWDLFIEATKLRGHRIYCVTMRYKKEGGDVEKKLLDKVDKIIYTSRRAKKPEVQSQTGEYVDIWIDDIPEFITENAIR